jgi:hypothetical protein
MRNRGRIDCVLTLLFRRSTQILSQISHWQAVVLRNISLWSKDVVSVGFLEEIEGYICDIRGCFVRGVPYRKYLKGMSLAILIVYYKDTVATVLLAVANTIIQYVGYSSKHNFWSLKNESDSFKKSMRQS